MTTNHWNMIQEMYSQCSEELKQKYDKKAGIYGIFCNGNLVYIGKSTSLLNRWIAHKCHVFCPESKEYNRPIYTELRRAYNLGCEITIDLLEYCNDNELEAKEKQWIMQYQPALNTLIPSKGGGQCVKQISKIC